MDGLAIAGRAKGLVGDRDDVARKAAARIVSDMILAGQGADVLKLAAVTATKGGAADDDKSGSRVLDAIRRMPGMAAGRIPSTEGDQAHQEPDQSATYEVGPPESQSVAGTQQPFFAPQLALLPVDGGELELAPGAAAGAGGPAPAGAPHPPAAHPRTPFYPPTAPLEKSETETGGEP